MIEIKDVIVEKAWRLNTSNLDESYFIDTSNIYYGTYGAAKSKALIEHDACFLLNGHEISFLNIRMVRSAVNDKILYNNEVIKRYQIADKIRANKILELDQDKNYYVQDKRNYVGNAVLWWGIDGNGYVTDLSKAHKYTYSEIQKFQPRDTDIIWESEHVETAIRQYVDMQGLQNEFSL